MYEFFCIIAAILLIAAVLNVIESFTKTESINSPYIALACILLFLLLYFLTDAHLNSKNYIIEKDKITTDTLSLDGSSYQLILPNDMKVCRDRYTLSLSEAWDYTVYRLYIDSTRYIEIRNSQYDTLDVKYGQLKVDKNE